MLDHQSRADASGFQQNGDAGKLIHGLLGWDKLIPESMAMYQYGARPVPRGRQARRRSAHVDDRRHRGRPPAVVAPHRRVPGGPARVSHRRTGHALARGQRKVPGEPPAVGYGGRGLVAAEHRFLRPRNADELAESPYRGFMQALVRARIPYVPVHADDIDARRAALAALVLPNLAACPTPSARPSAGL